MTAGPILPVGKLPAELLAQLIASLPSQGERVALGPGIGLDCAVLEFGDTCLVLKAEPITFASQEIGWYAVQIAVNDIVTTGAVPRWMMLTALLPEGKTTPESVAEISRQVAKSCRELSIALIGGHTEITYGIDRPILVTNMIGEVARKGLITPRGALPGDHLLLTKGIPIEATALLSREFPERLAGILSPQEIAEAQGFLYKPGISVHLDAQIAAASGGVHAMHDPTEGGLATALWELATASQRSLRVDLSAVPIPPLSAKVCQAFGLDPLGTIASGALLLACDPQKSERILNELHQQGIAGSIIGEVAEGPANVIARCETGWEPLKKYTRDEITRVYEKP